MSLLHIERSNIVEIMMQDIIQKKENILDWLPFGASGIKGQF